MAAVTNDALPENAIVIPQNPVRALVSQSLGEAGPAFDVREQQSDRAFDRGLGQASAAPDAVS
jgi:hypothetical protein